MSMSKRRESQQQEIWVPTHTLPETPSHPFYTNSTGCWKSMGLIPL